MQGRFPRALEPQVQNLTSGRSVPSYLDRIVLEYMMAAKVVQLHFKLSRKWHSTYNLHVNRPVNYECVSKSFWTSRLEPGVQMVQLCY
jgi:hypothetical protein